MNGADIGDYRCELDSGVAIAGCAVNEMNCKLLRAANAPPHED